MAVLNARPWDTEDLERPVVNTLEEWEIVNLTADTHPIHLHLVQFQAIERQPIEVERYLLDVFGTDELHPSDVGGGRGRSHPRTAIRPALGRTRRHMRCAGRTRSRPIPEW